MSSSVFNSPSQLRLSRSLDLSESVEREETLISRVSMSSPAATGRERTRSIGDRFSPRSFEKASAPPPKIAKGGSKKAKHVFKKLEGVLSTLSVVTVEKSRQSLHEACLRSFKKITFKHCENLSEWIFEQAKIIKGSVSAEPHHYAVIQANLKEISDYLNGFSEDQMSKKVKDLRELLNQVLSANFSSIADFALFCKKSVSSHDKKCANVFYRAIAGDEKKTVSFLDFLINWSRDSQSLERLSIDLYVHYLSRMTFEVFLTQQSPKIFSKTFSFDEFKEMKISLADVHRHVIHESTLIIKKIVINDVPVNDMDLFENKETRALKEESRDIYYKRILKALCPLNETDSDCFVKAISLQDLSKAETSNPSLEKVAHLMQAGTINFWKLAHERLLTLLPGHAQFKVSAEWGTIWHIHTEDENIWSLAQIKNYDVERNGVKLLSLKLHSIARFNFQEETIDSALTIPAVALNEIENTDHPLLVELFKLKIS